MRGHVRKRGNKWCAIIDIGRNPETGQRKQKWLSGFNTKKDAERAAAEFIAKYEGGQYADPQNMTLKGFLLKWLDDYAKTNVAPTTFKSYRETVRLEKLKPAQIQGFLSRLQREENQLSSTSVRYFYVVLNIALNTAVKWQLLATNPCQAVTPPKRRSADKTVLNEEQANFLLEQSKGTPLHIPIVLALTCGMRRGEVLGLKWENVDLAKATLHVVENRIQAGSLITDTTPKSKRSNRAIVMPKATVRILKEERKKHLENRLQLGPDYHDENYVVCWDDGRPYRPDYVTRSVHKFIVKIGLPGVSYHDLRHTHATLLLLKGVHPKIVQERLGHSTIAVTLDTYSHVLPSMQKEAADKLDTIFAN